ncbi:hypothetical protein OG756_05090 [Streptomyces sp. NBC_01310]|uniref:hypothetical protein n=1 Tax=Streptomyces sp. NBC_01310 TaxID=2903820 RepID=UPI0035B64EFC|nr:hypothetical protein OG756_05090 [Streptomyces sp. NBC_01310]
MTYPFSLDDLLAPLRAAATHREETRQPRRATEVSVVTADEGRWLCLNHRKGFGGKMDAIGNKS